MYFCSSIPLFRQIFYQNVIQTWITFRCETEIEKQIFSTLSFIFLLPNLSIKNFNVKQFQPFVRCLLILSQKNLLSLFFFPSSVCVCERLILMVCQLVSGYSMSRGEGIIFIGHLHFLCSCLRVFVFFCTQYKVFLSNTQFSQLYSFKYSNLILIIIWFQIIIS